MRFTIPMTVLVGLVMGVTSFNNNDINSPIPGYEIEDFTWEIRRTDSPEAPPTLISGTIQEVSDYLHSNPEYDHDLIPRFADDLDFDLQLEDIYAFNDITGKLKDKRESHQDPDPNTICNSFPPAGLENTMIGLRYLRQLYNTTEGSKEKPSNGPGPGRCGRVSCAYDTAIFWCNDNKETKTLPSWQPIIDTVWTIAVQCYNGTNFISGQHFNPDGWNVIIRGSPCKPPKAPKTDKATKTSGK